MLHRLLIFLLLGCSLSALEIELKNSNKFFLPDDIPKNEQLRGILVIRNYGGMGNLYSKRPKEWQDFLRREKMAFLLFTPQSGPGKKDAVSVSVGRSDIARLDKLLLEVETKSGYKNLKGLPFVPMGISRGGANSLCMALADPKRAIAAIGHHGESGIGINIKNVPVLYTHAQHEKLQQKRNVKINNWLLSIHGKSGIYYSTIMHKGASHGSYGSGKFALKWLQAIVEQRLGQDGKLKKMDSKKSWYAYYKIEGENTTSSKFVDCSISSKKSRKEKMWLPNQEVAEYWLEMMKAQY